MTFSEGIVSTAKLTSISYSLRNDDVIAAILLACLLLSVFILARYRKLLELLGQNFILHKNRSSLFISVTSADMRFMLLLVLQTCLLLGICLLTYFKDLTPELTQHVSPHLLLTLYCCICVVYFILKWITYLFVGWVFLDKTTVRLWIESYFTIIYFVGFVLFPLTLFSVYFNLSTNLLFISGIVILIVVKILIFYKSIKFFFGQASSLVALILYLCALEIIPIFMVFKGIIFANNLLLIKI
ncbi:DUF4271 domain-containing protein [Bacteroides sp. 214]|uniref:DUF4271 domain-containing protein n=1 Tax=Bacteroides sp. 214 TaxID=2302935 RepID=UPI0013D33C96|nr:DUF4271 domain-containing protein [Bacteroides sp. 214]NDW13030.1 DUF4271 domain-containing protein [Bacteroides sp. 214]